MKFIQIALIGIILILTHELPYANQIAIMLSLVLFGVVNFLEGSDE